MKKVLLLMFCALMGFALNAQVSENFSDYTVGGKLAQQAQAMGRDYWTTWSGAVGGNEDGVIGEVGGNKCGSFTGSTGSSTWNDQVLLLGKKTTGVWNITLKVYIPTGNCGFFNVLADFAGGSSTWALQVYFGCLGQAPNTLTPETGTMHIDGANSVGFNFLHDAWTDVRVYIDLDTDYAEIYINDDLIKSWVYTQGTFGDGCPRVIDALDIYPPVANNADFYIDDIVFEQIFAPVVLFETSFDDVDNGAKVAQSYPEWWTTWSNAPGGAEDALITDEQFLSDPQSAKLVDGNDLIFKAGDKTTGLYTIDFDLYIPGDVPAYFNVLQVAAGDNSQWAFDVFFNMKTNSYGLPVGTYIIHNDEETYFDLPPLNTWIAVKMVINLDEDEATLYVNEEEILTWTYSIDVEGNAGTRQLAGVDFWPPLATSVYYIDNFVYTQQGGDTYPVMSVIPDVIDEEGSDIVTVPVLITNEGTSMGDYTSWITFDATGGSTPGNFTMAYTSDTPGSIFYNQGDPAPLMELAAKYPSTTYCQMVGTSITQVSYYLVNPTEDNKLTARVYGQGTANSPGEILAEKTITSPVSGTWNAITLDTPVLLDGQDIWIAIEYLQIVGEGFGNMQCDAGPVHENGDWRRSNGGSWGRLHIAQPELNNGNFMIKALTSGNVVPTCWLSFSGETYGTVPAGGSKTFDVTLDPTTLEQGVYEATLTVITSDEENPKFEIPITFTVGISIDSRMDKILVDDEPATLKPGTTTYTITVKDVDKVFIEAIPMNEDATVTGDTGDQDVAEGLNTFNFKVTAQDGVHFTDYVLEVTMEISPAISEIDNTFKLFPNPVKDYLNITSEYTITIETITIYDLTGKVVKQVKQPGTSVNLSDLAAGYYMLKVTTEQGDTMHKFVKE